jgi:hypothetical protein
LRRFRINLALILLACCARIEAQTTAAANSARKWEIVDNSFLVEEAFNQEAGVVQNIFTWMLSRHGAWAGNFTQEWPVPGSRHQFSYSLVFSNTGEVTGLGDLLLNYRFQLTEETERAPAISPRLSLILPTGRAADGLGGGTTGLDMNLPASKQFGDFYLHLNAGYTWLPDVLSSTRLAGSGIWRVAPMLNLIVEAAAVFDESFTLSPGFRRGWNFGERQLVVGIAAPITRAEGRSTTALLTYLSYELPFR